MLATFINLQHVFHSFGLGLFANFTI